MKAKSLVSIVILTFNRVKLVKALLAELTKIEYPIEIIVVDNSSTNSTEKAITNAFPSIVYYKMTKNLGTFARNYGMIRSTGNYIITLDDDISGLSSIDIQTIISKFENDELLGVINFKVISSKTHKICNWVHHYKQEDYAEKEFLTYEITEGAVAFRKSALEKSGYYCRDFFISHEGPDLAFRILDNGFNVIYTNKISVLHSHSTSGRINWRNYYYDTRNQYILGIRNFPLLYLIRYLLVGQTSMLLHSFRDGFLFYWILGFLDGLKLLTKCIHDRQVLNKRTMKIIKKIDSYKPSILYSLKKQLKQRNFADM